MQRAAHRTPEICRIRRATGGHSGTRPSCAQQQAPRGSAGRGWQMRDTQPQEPASLGRRRAGARRFDAWRPPGLAPFRRDPRLLRGPNGARRAKCCTRPDIFRRANSELTFRPFNHSRFALQSPLKPRAKDEEVMARRAQLLLCLALAARLALARNASNSTSNATSSPPPPPPASATPAPPPPAANTTAPSGAGGVASEQLWTLQDNQCGVRVCACSAPARSAVPDRGATPRRQRMCVAAADITLNWCADQIPQSRRAFPPLCSWLAIHRACARR